MKPLCHDHPYDLDTGSVLWDSYNASKSKWVALLRMNAMNLDPLFYGVYGHQGVAFAYHEGAGTTQVTHTKVHPTPVDDSEADYNDASHALREAVDAARDEVLGLVRARYQLKHLVAPVANGNLSSSMVCVSIQPGTSNNWCSTTCAKAPRAPGEVVCPDNICSCKEKAAANSNTFLDTPADQQAETHFISGMDELVELLLHPETSPLRKSDLVDRCEAAREQLVISAAARDTDTKSVSPVCLEQIENLCRASPARLARVTNWQGCSGTKCHGWTPVADGPCTAHHDEDRPCCGQDKLDIRGKNMDVRPCPEDAPVCLDYIYDRRQGRCQVSAALVSR